MLLAAEAFLRLAACARPPVNFDVGPSTGPYLTGFSESEERPPVSFRWTGRRASIDLPLAGTAGSTTPRKLAVRYARFLETYARVHVFVNGRSAASFSARPGRFRTARFEAEFPRGPVRIEILTDDPDPTHLGVAIDWIRLEGDRWRLVPSLTGPLLLVAGLYVLCLACGFGPLGAGGAAAALGLAQGAWFAVDPFGMAHVNAKIALTSLLLSGAAVAVLRRKPSRRWVTLIFLAGYLVKGAAIFHPSYFYPDVRLHRRYVFALAEAEGSLSQRGVTAQMKAGTAYPRRVGDKVYAFPYSPLLFVPFTWLPRDPHLVEDGLKHLALAAAAAEVIAVYWLAGLLLGPGGAVAAALLAAVLPPMVIRLFLAMWPTVVGHLFDTLAIGAAAALASHPGDIRRLFGFGGATLVSFLTYIGSLFNLSAFTGAFFLLVGRSAWRVLAIGAGAALATILSLYLSFTVTFFREIIPTLLASSSQGKAVSLASGLQDGLGRLVYFYGYGYLALAAAGVVVARRKCESHGFRCLTAYALSFALLMTLRVVSGGLFKDLKEILYVGPLVAISAGASLATLAERGRSGKLAASFIICGLIIFFCVRFGEYFARCASLAGLAELSH